MQNIIPQDDAPLKRCPSCPEDNQWHPATCQFFSPDNRKAGRFALPCKNCRKRRYAEKHPPEHPKVEGKLWCTGCNEYHLATSDFFYADTRRGNGFRTPCKQHINEYEATENRQAQKRVYKHGHYQEHAEEIKKYVREHTQLHKDEVSRQRKQFREENKERLNHVSHLYYHSHKECSSLYSRQYRETHREARRARHRNRKARQRAIPGTLTPQQVQDKLKAQHYRCYYAACDHAKFEKRNGSYVYHIEHTIPISRTEAGPRNDVNYVVLACPACNMSKQDKLPHEWFEGGRLF